MIMAGLLNSTAVEITATEVNTITAEVNCTNFFTHKQFEILAIARGMSAGISFLACTFAVVLIAYFHALDSLLKRLFLYLTVATGANLAALVLQLHEHFDEDEFCALTGFFVQYTTHIGLYIKIGASATLLYYVRKPYQDQRNQREERTKHFLEFAFLAFSVLFPLVYTWVPFLFDAYGRAGAWCWIRRINYADCSEVPGGLPLQIVLGYAPTILVATLSTIVIITIVGTYCRLAKRLNQNVQSALQREAAEALLLVAYFFIFGIYCVIELVCSLAATSSSYDDQPLFSFGIWVLYAILTPFMRLGIPVSFVVYLFCIRKIKCCRCYQKYHILNGRNQQPQEERMNNRELEGVNQRRPRNTSSHMQTSFPIPREFSNELTESVARRPSVVMFELPDNVPGEPSSACATSFVYEYEFSDEHEERQPLNVSQRHVQYDTVP